MPQRFGEVPVVAAAVFTSTVLPLYVYAHVAFSDSGVLPSSMFSIDPDVSRRTRTFGSGGLTSICACDRSAIANAAAAARMDAEPLRYDLIDTPCAWVPR